MIIRLIFMAMIVILNIVTYNCCFIKKSQANSKLMPQESEEVEGEEESEPQFKDIAVYVYQFEMWLAICMQIIMEADYY